MSKKSSILTGAFVAGTIALGALTGCQTAVGPEEKPDPKQPDTTIIKPDTSKTKPDTTVTKPDTSTWKPLVQVYIFGTQNKITKEETGELGWATLYSKDGEWDMTGATRVELRSGNFVSAPKDVYYDQMCEKLFKTALFVNNEYIYFQDATKGCRPVPESGLDL